MIILKKSINILGIDVCSINIPCIVTTIKNNIRLKNWVNKYITVTGVHGIMESQADIKVKNAHHEAWMSVPDGMPLVYIGRLHGHREICRCYGPDLMAAMMEASRDGSIKHFFYGGKENRAEELKRSIEKKYPGVRIVGCYTPPFRPPNENEEKKLLNILSKKKPDIMWIGLSTPKQELFMYKYINKIPVRLMIGVGAAFDIHTGYISSAPKWMQKMALEWVFRIIQEPKRLSSRYLKNNPRFIFSFLLQEMGLRKKN